MFNATTLDIALTCFQLLGIPVAIFLWFLNKRRERRDREYGTYDALDDKYIDYLQLCLQNTDLDVGDIPKKSTAEPLTPDQAHRELLVLTILLSIMERAYLMYKDKSSDVRKRQWEGWNAYMRDWSKRANFVAALPRLKQFDSGFVAELESHFASSGPE